MPSVSEYVSCAWDPFTNKEIEAPEMVQSQGVRMVCKLTGRRGVTEDKDISPLEQLDARPKNSHIILLHKFCQEKSPILHFAHLMMTS